MKQLLYVTDHISGSGVGGREQLSQLHAQILLELFGDGFERIELDRIFGINKIFGYINGVSRSSIDRVCSRIRASGANQVFLDGSNLGRLAEGIRKSISGVEIVTFFHNCEVRFFLGAFRQFRTIRSLGVLVANYLAERRAVRYSDKLICLSERDSNLLRKLYGRGATHVSAMALQDRLTFPIPAANRSGVRYALFVGGTFYANKAGIAWFAEYVAPRIPIKTYVVGRGFESLKDALERHGNVEVIGAVDMLAPWYLDAQFVVAPIFDGSGMKTKIAEALMFGKTIVGTPEAFVGYEDVADHAGSICSTADEFVCAIERLAREAPRLFNPELRALYDEKYSYPAARSRLAAILGVME